MLVLKKHFFAPLAIVFLAMGTACTVVQEYDVKISELDTEVNLFEDGLALPLGSTNKVVLSSLLNSAGESLDEFLKKDPDGTLVLTYQGDMSLSEELKALDLSSLASVDGVNLSQNVSYHIGDIDPEKFAIPAQNFELSVPFTSVQSVNLELPSLAANLDALSFKAGMNNYANVINGNSAVQLSDKFSGMNASANIQKNDKLNELAGKLATYVSTIPGFDGDSEYPITDESYFPDMPVNTSIQVSMPPVKLHDNIKSIKNIQLNPNAKMTITLSVTNAFISSGALTPNIGIDLSGIFDIAGVNSDGKLDLSPLSLSPENNFTATKTWDINGLATKDYGNEITIDTNVSVVGELNLVTPISTSYNKLTAGDMKMEMAITFQDLTIESAEIGINQIDQVFPKQVVNIGTDSPIALPSSIKQVKEVTMDPTKPLYLSITPANLDCFKSLDLLYDITLEFSDEIQVQGAVDGKLNFQGDLAEAPLNEAIVIESFSPTAVTGGVLVKASVGVSADISAQNIVLSTADIPTTADKDLSFSVGLDGSPAVSNVIVTINDFEHETNLSDNFEFDVNSIESVGKFTVTPEGAPALRVNCSIPTLPGLSIVPGPEGISMTLPDVIKFDGSALTSPLEFDESSNTLLIKGSLPSQIILPITSIEIEPDSEGKVKTGYAVSGKIVIPSADINTSDLQGVSGESFGISVGIDKITAKTIDLGNAIDIPIDKKIGFAFTLGQIENIVKEITEVSLNDVYFNMGATFTGLPKMGDDNCSVNIDLILPDFIVPNKIELNGDVVDNKLSIAPCHLEKLANIVIADLPTNDKGEKVLQDSVYIKGNITLVGHDIDLSTLSSDVGVKFDASLGDANGKISIDKVSGIFSYDIEQGTTIGLEDIKKALTMEDGTKLTLDIADPQVTLSMSTNIGIALQGDLELIPITGGVEQTEDKISCSIALPYSTNPAVTDTKSYVICKSAATAPAGYTVIEADISKLLINIPDSLKISIKAGVDESVPSVLEMAAVYNLDVSYGVRAPLAFGENFLFSTSTEIAMDSVSEFTQYGEFGVKGKAVNESPVNLNISMTLLDGEGSEIQQSKTSTINIAGNATSDIEFYLSPTDKSRSIAKARLDINVTAIPGMPFTENSSVQLKDLAAVLPEGLSYTVPGL